MNIKLTNKMQVCSTQIQYISGFMKTVKKDHFQVKMFFTNFFLNTSQIHGSLVGNQKWLLSYQNKPIQSKSKFYITITTKLHNFVFSKFPTNTQLIYHIFLILIDLYSELCLPF